MSRKPVLALLPMMMGGCVLADPHMPLAGGNDSRPYETIRRIGWIADNTPVPTSARFDSAAGISRNGLLIVSGCETRQMNTADPRPGNPPLGLEAQRGPNPARVRCSYGEARQYLQNRMEAAQMRETEMRRWDSLGRTVTFVGIAGAAGNMLFHGATAANLSWTYPAAVAYGAHQAFVPDGVRFAYTNGVAALSCVANRADAAWAAGNTIPALLVGLESARGDLEKAVSNARTGTPHTNARALQRQQDRAKALGDSLDKVVKAIKALANPGQTPDNAHLSEVERERLRLSFEQGLANAVVSFTELTATAINASVDQATPTIEQIRTLAQQISADAKRDANVATTSTTTTGANDTKNTTPATTGAVAAPLAAAAATPQQPATDAAAQKKSADLQAALNSAAIAAQALKDAMETFPNFTHCIEPLLAKSSATPPSTPAAPKLTPDANLILGSDDKENRSVTVQVNGGVGNFRVLPVGPLPTGTQVTAGAPRLSGGLSELVTGTITIVIPMKSAGTFTFAIQDLSNAQAPAAILKVIVD